jgi:hypothetical protein
MTKAQKMKERILDEFLTEYQRLESEYQRAKNAGLWQIAERIQSVRDGIYWCWNRVSETPSA